MDIEQDYKTQTQENIFFFILDMVCSNANFNGH